MGKKGFFTLMVGTAAAAAAVSLRKKGEDYHVEIDVKPSKLGKTEAQAREELEKAAGEHPGGEADR